MQNESTAQRVASNVRAEMARVKLSQVKVAGLLQLSQPAISRRLSGQIPFDVEELSRIADALGVPVLELFAA